MPNMPAFAQWLIDLCLYPLRKAFELIMGWLGDTIAAIPVPAWLSDIANPFASLPSGVIWFLTWFKAGEGLTIVLAAYAIRFFIRRLPVVG